MENINNSQVSVNNITITGIQHTNHDFIKRQFEKEKIFTEMPLQNVLKSIDDIHDRLTQLDIYDKINIKLDKDKISNSQSDSKANLHLFIDVQEKKRQTFNTSFLCGLDNTVGFNLKYLQNNLFGRAEKLDVNYHSDFNALGGSSLTFIKPLEGFPHMKLSVGLFDQNFDHWWSKFLESSSGVFSEMSLKTKLGLHQYRLESAWKEIVTSSKAPLDIKQDNGDSMRVSFKHTFTKSSTQSQLYPRNQLNFYTSQEIFTDMLRQAAPHTGLTNINLKCDAEIQKSIGLLDGRLIIENTLGAGFINSLSQPHTQVPIADRFFLGGPLTLRGMDVRSMGPVSSQDGVTPCGTNKYIQHGLHVYCPLPFIAGSTDANSNVNMFRLHGFINTASSGPVTLNNAIPANENAGGDFHGNATAENDTVQKWLNSIRCTAGAGIVFKLHNSFRVELNYCLPLRYLPGDKIVSGFQFGIGIVYM